jgi:RNA polymerase sigma factor (TIGR02999 family)
MMTTLTRCQASARPEAHWPAVTASPSVESPSASDYTATQDVELVVFARKIQDQSAVSELIARHYPRLRQLVAGRARRSHLKREDTEDAQQDVVFALLEAIVDYDLLEASRPGGCSFGTFAGRRALSRFHNWLRRLRWLQALVHEAYLRLVGKGSEQPWNSRGHFFAAAAEAMRRILVENARRKKGLKHGGDLSRRELDEERLTAPEPREDLLALDAALNKLAAGHRQAADLVQLRYFAGLTLPEAAQALRISPRTAARLWAYARAWLRREIEEAEGAGEYS